MDQVNLYEGLQKIREFWDPHLVTTVNDHEIKVAKIKGEFVWHHHDNTDELFMVLKGTLKMETEGETKILKEGDIYVVKKGVEHRPIAEEEVHILMIEQAGTVNTGNLTNEKTKTQLKKLS